MTKLQWAAVAAALGAGILAQIPGHDESLPGAHEHGPAPGVAMPGLTTVTLAVSGMT